MASNTFGFEGERAELASLLSSGYFDRSPNLYRFLVFVCEKYFRGEADEVKEYSVAVEALGRPQNFDQKKDSIVRVEAHRLRKRLDEYYAGEGASHPCRIVLPSGSYVPQFLVHEGSGQDLVRLAEAPDPPARAASPTHAAGRSVPASPVRPAQWTRGTWQRFLAAAAALLLMLISILTWNALNRSESNALADEPAITTAPAVPPVASLDAKGENGIRLLAGSPLSSFVDRFGHTWTGDAFFNGGSAVETRMPNLRFTAVPELYGHRREGEFGYDIPLAPGNYELRLHFAEPIFGLDKLAGGGETSRLFNVSLNGEPILVSFDIVADAFGENNTDIKVFKDVQPAADGRLHLRFTAGQHESPILSALEVIPSKPGLMNPVRIVASDRGFYDPDGDLWQADNFVSGGRIVRRSPIELPNVNGNLFASERYGNFTYMIPVAVNGRYRVRIHFCERWFGPDTHASGGKGSRIFDVYGNGRSLLSAFDLFAEAGGVDLPIIREFSGLVPNTQGKLILQFVPRENYALVNAIEVIDESK